MRLLRYIQAIGTFALFLALTISLSADAPNSYALIQNSCAPWDGAAVEVTLTKEPAECNRSSGPFLEIGVWRGLPLHAGQEVKFGPGFDAGFASQCAKVGDCQRAESGTIVFEKYQEGGGASGHYELHFKGGKTINGTFHAKWCHKRVMCG